MIPSILALLAAIFEIWAFKEKHKYEDRYMELRKAYYEESNKPRPEQDDAVMDNLRFEINLLADVVSDLVIKQAKNEA